MTMHPIDVGTDGFRQILGVAEVEKEGLAGWKRFLCHSKDRGLEGVREMRLRTAAELLEQKVAETLTYHAFPSTHWWQIRTNNPIERGARSAGRGSTSDLDRRTVHDPKRLLADDHYRAG